MELRGNWYWGLLGCLGFLGLIDPVYYVFFVFFLFFLGPALGGKGKKEGKKK